MSTNIVKEEHSFSSSSYVDKEDLPKINGVTIIGDISLNQIGVYNKHEIEKRLKSANSIMYLEEKPTYEDIHEGTIYYIGTEEPYDIYMYVMDERTGGLKEILLGTTSFDASEFLTKTGHQMMTEDQSIVGGINELQEKKLDKEDKNLLTEDKTIVGAVNEVYAGHDDLQDVEDNRLVTESKTIVGAINEILEHTNPAQAVSPLQIENGKLNHVAYASLWNSFSTYASGTVGMEDESGKDVLATNLNIDNGHATSHKSENFSFFVPKYIHYVCVTFGSSFVCFFFINNTKTAYTSVSSVASALMELKYDEDRRFAVQAGGSNDACGVYPKADKSLGYTAVYSSGTRMTTKAITGVTGITDIVVPTV